LIDEHLVKFSQTNLCHEATGTAKILDKAAAEYGRSP
jgi:hypothetical protein